MAGIEGVLGAIFGALLGFTIALYVGPIFPGGQFMAFGYLIFFMAIVGFAFGAYVVDPPRGYSMAGRGFVARKIAQLINEGEKGKVAQAIAFSEARRKGYKVPKRPNN